ncbi:LuxR family transcriptional regulator [Pelomonas sp. HMWF004]|nr:LuxR family transcriptional regulator [Pelomonas sp. HMWF004]
MNLQHYEAVSQAPDLVSFRQALIDFAQELDFGLVVGVLAIEQPLHAASPVQYVSVGNTPQSFLQASKDPALAKRDPVHQKLTSQCMPVVYDQDFYVQAGAGELWEMVAPFGYRTGVAVGVHMPGQRRLLLGVDRDQPLPGNAIQLNRLVADLQLLAVHAQDAAARLMTPPSPGTGRGALSERQVDILRLSMQGKSAWVVGTLLGISENTVNYHLKQIFRHLAVATKQQAVVKALELGLL